MDGQFSFFDYEKTSISEKPKLLVKFINEMGESQYNQIGNVIENTCEHNHYDMPEDSIGRITNAVSVWLLKIGEEYEKYLNSILEIKNK